MKNKHTNLIEEIDVHTDQDHTFMAGVWTGIGIAVFALLVAWIVGII